MTEDWTRRVRDQPGVNTLTGLLQSSLLLLLDLLLQRGHRSVDLVLLRLLVSHGRRHGARSSRAGGGQSCVQSRHDLVTLSVMSGARGG